MLHSLDKIVAQRYWAWIICAILAAVCLGLVSVSWSGSDRRWSAAP